MKGRHRRRQRSKTLGIIGIVLVFTSLGLTAESALEWRVSDLERRVGALDGEVPLPSPSPSPTPTQSPSPTPSPSPSTSPSATPSPSPTPSPIPVPGLPGPEPVGPGGGVFSISCDLDHQAKDDPIVFFGQPFASHFHDFFGARGVDAFTTVDQLGGDGTTCELAGDTAAYWAPSVMGPDGTVVQPTRILAYYAAPEGEPVRALPHGLKMVAGGVDPDFFGFSCSDQGPYSETPVDCPQKLVLHVVFPSCWDGVNLDSLDHRSHMSYTCDDAHPIRVARLSIHVQYPDLTDGASGYHLAPNPDGSLPDAHADFFNGWDQIILEQLVALCANTGHDNSGVCKQPPI